MFCPDCGIKNVEERKYCSNCGTSLQIIKRVTKLAKNADASKLDHLKRAYSLEQDWNKAINKGLLVIGSGLLYSATIFTIGFLVKKYFHYDLGRLLKDLSIFGLLFLTVGSMIIAYGRLQLRKKNTDLALSDLLMDELPQTDRISPKQISNTEVYNFDNYTPNSVIENTTKELLKVPVTPRSLNN